jgi:hypothetical protein
VADHGINKLVEFLIQNECLDKLVSEQKKKQTNEATLIFVNLYHQLLELVWCKLLVHIFEQKC